MGIARIREIAVGFLAALFTGTSQPVHEPARLLEYPQEKILPETAPVSKLPQFVMPPHDIASAAEVEHDPEVLRIKFAQLALDYIKTGQGALGDKIDGVHSTFFLIGNMLKVLKPSTLNRELMQEVRSLGIRYLEELQMKGGVKSIEDMPSEYQFQALKRAAIAYHFAMMQEDGIKGSKTYVVQRFDPAVTDISLERIDQVARQNIGFQYNAFMQLLGPHNALLYDTDTPPSLSAPAPGG